MASAPSTKIERAHQMYREGRYDNALAFYTEALSMAKTKAQKIALHSNRAACYLKLHHFKKAAEECTSVLELDHKHTGALMLRAQTLVTLKEYQAALFDVNQLIELNPSSEVYHNLQTRLRTQLSLAPIPESEAELEEEEEEEEEQEVEEYQIEEKQECDEDKYVISSVIGDQKVDTNMTQRNSEDITPKPLGIMESREQEKPLTSVPIITSKVVASQEQSIKDSKGWQAIPKPKGHSALDYARWDRVEDDSSEDDDDDDEEEESLPQYRFRVKTVGVRPVK